ncbi:SDR family oxidoreductase [Antrihabitans cavernicola]|uniref:SDR family oxidoreductase n=1 Tax=Antrihabitans cavernicola TaxID=2495913 RepID=UPI0025B6B6C7|nr:SDR family oxidoreductase [Spelaeibacter cavernicola]
MTGASSGVGAETARHLSAAGAKVVLGAQIGLPDGAVVQTDVTDRQQVTALVQNAVNLHGRIDVMINNAGLMPLSPHEMERFDEREQAIDVNIKGVLWGSAAALPHFKQQRSGQFVNVSSVAGHAVNPGGAIYSATKYSMRVISEVLRQEVKPYNIRTTVISPGAVDTEVPGSVKADGVAASVADFYRDTAIPANSFARCVAFAIGQPENVDINEILFRPTNQQR